MENIELIVGRLEGQLGAFISTHTQDMQRIDTKLKENKTFLEGEVAKALNSHSEMKQDLKILKERHYNCPIMEVERKVKNLEDTTEKERFLSRNPDLKNTSITLQILKYIGWIVAGVVVGSSVINTLIDLFHKIKI